MFEQLKQHRQLILQLVRREVQQRYRDSYLGLLWSFIYPVLMLLVYMFVFGVVMRMKWGVGEQSTVAFGVVMFAGLILHSFLSEILVRSTTLIREHAQFVKKVVFPLPILPVIIVLSAVFHMGIGLIILLIVAPLTGTFPGLTVLLLPIVLLPFICLSMGFALFLCGASVYLRDLQQIIGVVTTVMLFLSPILYPLSVVPENLQILMLWLNPLTIVVEQLRAITLFGAFPDWSQLAIYSVVSVIVLITGLRFFVVVQKGFIDVI